MAKKQKTTAAKQHTVIEIFSIAEVEWRLGPFGLIYYAKDYLAAAGIFPGNKTNFQPARHHAICHSIELSLKAFLCLNEFSLSELSIQQYGHDLQALLKAAERNDLQSMVVLSPGQRLAIECAAKYHLEKVFQYPALMEALHAYPQTPDDQLLLEAAKVLVDALYEPCLTAS